MMPVEGALISIEATIPSVDAAGLSGMNGSPRSPTTKISTG